MIFDEELIKRYDESYEEYMKLFNGVCVDSIIITRWDKNVGVSDIYGDNKRIPTTRLTFLCSQEESASKPENVKGFVEIGEKAVITADTTGKLITVVMTDRPDQVKILLVGIEPDKKISNIATLLTYETFDYAKETFANGIHSYTIDCLNAQERIKELTKRDIKPIDEQYLDLTTGLSVEQFGMIQNAASPVAAAMHLESFISNELDKEKTL